MIDLLLATGSGEKPSLEGREKLHNVTKCVNDPRSESLLSVWTHSSALTEFRSKLKRIRSLSVPSILTLFSV